MKNLLKFGALVCLLATLCLSQTATRAGGRWRVGGSASDNSAGHITLSSITLSPLNQSQIAGSSIGLTATAHYSNGSTFDLTKIAQWVSSNTAIVSLSLPAVGNTETALCNSAGTALVSVTFGGVTASTNVTCTGIVPPTPTLVSIAVTPTSPSVSVGQTNGVTATGTYSDGSKQPITASVTWTSGTTSVATIGVLGATQGVICKSGGTSVITATDPATSISGNTTVTCNAVLSSLVVTPASPSTTIGGTQGFLATGTYSDGSQQDVTAQANWTSGTLAVATVSTTRTVPQVVNAISAGTSTITAAVGSVSGNTVFTVTTPGGHTPPTVSSVSITGGTTVNVGGTLSLIATCTYSDGTTGNCSAAPTTWTSSTANTSLQLPDCIVGLPCNITLPGTGSTPRTWTVPAKAAPSGAIDVLDYAAMPLPDRNNFHLNPTSKSFRVEAGLLMWLKGSNSPGGPADGELFDANYIKQWYTEGPTFSNLSGYKRYINPVNLWPRYFVPGTDIVTLTPGPNLYSITESCGADNLAPINNLDIKGELQGPFTDVNFGGSIPNNTPYLLATKYIKGTGGVYQNREQYWLVLGFGQVQWQASHWNGSTYAIDQTSINNLKVAGGPPTPNFACGIPPLPITGGLPPGAVSTAAPQLTIGDSTGTISGSPSTVGSYPFTAQEEDGAGAFHLFPNTLRIDQTASSAQETLTGVSAGTSLITATVGAVSGNVTVTVQTPAPTLSSIQVTPTTPAVYTGSNAGFTATGTYSDGSKQNLTGTVVWSSGTPAVATIGTASNPQTVNCLTAGTSVITATLGLSGNTTLTCQAPVAPTIGIDFYCPGGTPSFGSTDGPATLPQTCYYTDPSVRPTSGTVRTATAATWTSVWAATNCDDVVEIAANTVVSGNLSIPTKVCSAGHYRTLRVTGFTANFPAYGTRVSPCYFGVASRPGYPNFNCSSTTNFGATIQSTGTSPTLTLVGPISGLQIEGIRITRTAGTGFIARLIASSGTGFDHIILDRSWLDGSMTTTDDTTRGIDISSMDYFAALDSLFTEFHCQSNGSCSDAQAILDGEDSSGVTKHTRKIVGDFCTASGQGCYLSGGGGANTTPKDLEYRLNWSFGPMTWNPADPTFQGGTPYQKKNNLEFKNFDQALVEGNVFQNNHDGFSQNGSMILLTPKNQSGSQCPTCYVKNITIRYNYSTTSNYAIQIANVSPAGVEGNRYSIRHNLFDNLGYATCYLCGNDLGNGLDGGLYTQPGLAASDSIHDVLKDHNAFIPALGAPNKAGTFALSGPLLSSGQAMANYTLTNNLVPRQGSAFANPLDSCTASPITNCACPTGSSATITLNQCFGTSGYSFGGNAIIQPTPTSTVWPGSNCLAETSLANLFVNYANGNAGVANLAGYKIKTTSPCHNSGTDGTDPGPDINTLLNRIQNVGTF